MNNIKLVASILTLFTILGLSPFTGKALADHCFVNDSPPQAKFEMFGPIASKVYGNGSDILVFVLHGDAESSKAASSYLECFAYEISTQNTTTTVVLMARPGTKLREGQKSKGYHSRQKRDHYTKKNNDLIAQGMTAATKIHNARKVVSIGHSGGAAQTGIIIGRYPDLIDTAILISCPCDVPRWRRHRNPGGRGWRRSQSPIKYVNKTSKQTKIIAITGANDTNTPTWLVMDYINKATSAGLHTTHEIVRGANHRLGGWYSPALSIIKKELSGT